jgi:magnesium transporter
MADLMDKQFVALKAADDQETAIGVFEREHRTALPVTDSSGILIGIVTIDDVLRVAEAAAAEVSKKSAVLPHYTNPLSSSACDG